MYSSDSSGLAFSSPLPEVSTTSPPVFSTDQYEELPGLQLAHAAFEPSCEAHSEPLPGVEERKSIRSSRVSHVAPSRTSQRRSSCKQAIARGMTAVGLLRKKELPPGTFEYTVMLGDTRDEESRRQNNLPKLRAVFSAVRVATRAAHAGLGSGLNAETSMDPTLQALLKLTSSEPKRIVLTLRVDERMTLSWDSLEPILEPGSCSLVAYPKVSPRIDSLEATLRDANLSQSKTRASEFITGKHSTKQAGNDREARGLRYTEIHGGAKSTCLRPASEAVLAAMIILLMEQHGDKVEQHEDISGAKLIHCLLLANTDTSVALAERLIHERPRLLLAVHSEWVKAAFEGEGCLHILAVNQREDVLSRILNIAYNSFSTQDLFKLLSQRVIGPFFAKAPMSEFGVTPISYMACFGLREPLEVLFGTSDEADDGLLTANQYVQAHNRRLTDRRGSTAAERSFSTPRSTSVGTSRAAIEDTSLRWELINGESACGGRSAYYPIHAVVACGQPEMYDFLVERCGARALAIAGSVTRDRFGHTPLQLAAFLGLKTVFKHILQKRTKMVWSWGPVSEHMIPLDEIDSANSHGEHTVMEVLVHSDAIDAAKEFLLDDFMNGFLYNQYIEKWSSFGRRVYTFRMILLGNYVILLTLIAAPSIVNDFVYMANGADDTIVYLWESDAWLWIHLSATVLLFVWELDEVYLSITSSDAAVAAASSEGEDSEQQHWLWRGVLTRLSLCHGTLKMVFERRGDLLIVSVLCSVIADICLLADAEIIAPSAAVYQMHAGRGIMLGAIRFLFSLASITGWISLITEGYKPLERVATFVNVVINMLLVDVKKFIFIFLPLLFGFATAMNALLLPNALWQTRWSSWWLTVENLLLLSFLQEPPMMGWHVDPQDEVYPSSMASVFGEYEEHGVDAVLPTLFFYLLYITFIILAVILLINLLIAMMSQTYEKMDEKANLDHRVEFGRLVLRFERLVEQLSTRFCFLDVNTHIGKRGDSPSTDDAVQPDGLQRGETRRGSQRGEREGQLQPPPGAAADGAALPPRATHLTLEKTDTQRQRAGEAPKPKLIYPRYQSFRSHVGQEGGTGPQLRQRGQQGSDLFAESPKTGEQAVHAELNGMQRQLEVLRALIEQSALVHGGGVGRRGSATGSGSLGATPLSKPPSSCRASGSGLTRRLSIGIVAPVVGSQRGSPRNSLVKHGTSKAAIGKAGRQLLFSEPPVGGGGVGGVAGGDLLGGAAALAVAATANDATAAAATRISLAVGVTPLSRLSDIEDESRRNSSVDRSSSVVAAPPNPLEVTGEEEAGFALLRRSVAALGGDGAFERAIAVAWAEATGGPDARLRLEHLEPFLLRVLRLEAQPDDEHVAAPAIQALTGALDISADGHVEQAELLGWLATWLGQHAAPVHALLIIDVQNDFIDGTLALRHCPAGEDAAEVVPVINVLRETVDFDCVVLSLDWHPEDHCSFVETVTAGRSPAPIHPTQSAEEAERAHAFERIVLTAPDGVTPMPQELWPSHCVQGRWGSECHPDLVTSPSDVVVHKGTNGAVDSYSAFYDNSKLQQTELLAELRRRRVTHVHVCGLALDVCVAYTALHAAEEGFVTSVILDASRGVSHDGMTRQLGELRAAGVRLVKAEQLPEITEEATLDEAVLAARHSHAAAAVAARVQAAPPSKLRLREGIRKVHVAHKAVGAMLASAAASDDVRQAGATQSLSMAGKPSSCPSGADGSGAASDDATAGRAAGTGRQKPRVVSDSV